MSSPQSLNDKSLKTCSVCGDKALGFNFNAITCESCKAFFRRNALLNKEFTCPFSEHCEITAITRRFCQKCRLEKCFSIGMKKEHIMSEEEKILKRMKIEQNKAKKRIHSTTNEEPNSLKIKREQYSDLSLSESNLLGNSEYHVPSPFEESNDTSTNFNSPKEITSTTSESPEKIKVEELEITSESNSTDIVDRIINSPIGAKKVIDKLMNTQENAVNVMAKIICSPKDAIELIGHLISAPGDALHIISKIMNSPLDALTVFTQFMSSPTDAIQVITKIVSSPKDVLQFMQQLMNNPADALQIMTKFMNSPAEALRLINKMMNQSEVDSTTTTTSTTTTVDKTSLNEEITLTNPMIKEMLGLFKNHNQTPNTPSTTSNTITCDSTPVTDSEIKSDQFRVTDVTEDVLQAVEQTPIVPHSIESILCEAIKLEYESYSNINQTNSTSRELNDAEQAKLNELIVSNKALNAPVDDDLSTLISDDCIQSNQVQPDPQLLTVINLTAVAIRRLIKMAKKISAFKNMCQEDQVALLKGGCIEMMLLRSAMQYDLDSDQWTIPHRKEAMSNLKADILKLAKGNVYEEHEKFMKNFDPKWRLDENIILIMCAIALFSPHRAQTVHSDVIKLEQNSYYYLLRRYLESVYPGCEAKSTFLKLIQKIHELHKLNDEIVNVYLDVNPSQVEPLLRELFDMKTNQSN